MGSLVIQHRTICIEIWGRKLSGIVDVLMFHPSVSVFSCICFSQLFLCCVLCKRFCFCCCLGQGPLQNEMLNLNVNFPDKIKAGWLAGTALTHFSHKDSSLHDEVLIYRLSTNEIQSFHLKAIEFQW